MKTLALLVIALAGTFSTWTDQDAQENPSIDREGWLRNVRAAEELRAKRRVSEAEFMRMAKEKGTIVLDARSKEKFDLLHIKGAVNLPFPDITVASIAKVIPDKSARVLIYCNNNFKNAEEAFPAKVAEAALNHSPYVTLYSYGYREVFELEPLLDPATAAIEFEGRAAPAKAAPIPTSRPTSRPKPR